MEIIWQGKSSHAAERREMQNVISHGRQFRMPVQCFLVIKVKIDRSGYCKEHKRSVTVFWWDDRCESPGLG